MKAFVKPIEKPCVSVGFTREWPRRTLLYTRCIAVPPARCASKAFRHSCPMWPVSISTQPYSLFYTLFFSHMNWICVSGEEIIGKCAMLLVGTKVHWTVSKPYQRWGFVSVLADWCSLYAFFNSTSYRVQQSEKAASTARSHKDAVSLRTKPKKERPVRKRDVISNQREIPNMRQVTSTMRNETIVHLLFQAVGCVICACNALTSYWFTFFLASLLLQHVFCNAYWYFPLRYTVMILTLNDFANIRTSRSLFISILAIT